LKINSQNWACSTSRNTGTRNTGTPEYRNIATPDHPGTSRNIPEHPKNPGTPPKTRNTPQNPGTPQKTRKSSKSKKKNNK